MPAFKSWDEYMQWLQSATVANQQQAAGPAPADPAKPAQGQQNNPVEFLKALAPIIHPQRHDIPSFHTNEEWRSFFGAPGANADWNRPVVDPATRLAAIRQTQAQLGPGALPFGNGHVIPEPVAPIDLSPTTRQFPNPDGSTSLFYAVPGHPGATMQTGTMSGSVSYPQPPLPQQTQPVMGVSPAAARNDVNLAQMLYTPGLFA